MSNIAITPNSSGTGTISITAPNTNTNRTIALPDVAGNVVTTGDTGTVATGMLASTLDLSGKTVNYGLTGSDMPVGSVLQVVQVSTTTPASQGGTVYASAGLSGTITPTSSSSKILIMVTQYYTFRTTTTSERQAFFRLMRGSTEIMETVYDRISTTAVENRYGTTAAFNWLDSPNTTSAITYSTQFRLNGTASDLYAQHDNAQSIITFLEIGA